MVSFVPRPDSVQLRQIKQLLIAEGLPTQDLDDADIRYWVAEHQGLLAGVAAIEMFGDVGLLRSVAVDPSYRGKGLGESLTRSVLGFACEKRLSAVYLLTETADNYFTRFGFSWADRSTVPESIQQSYEFSTACPASARVFVFYPTISP